MHQAFNLALLFLCINLILYIFPSYFPFFFYVVLHSNTFTCYRDIALFECGGEDLCKFYFIILLFFFLKKPKKRFSFAFLFCFGGMCTILTGLVPYSLILACIQVGCT